MPAGGLLRLTCAVLLTGEIAATAGCDGIRVEPPVRPPTTSAPAEPARTPDPAARCFGPGAVNVPMTTTDGVRLAGVRLGSGPRGLVLIHQEDGDMCQWHRHAPRWAELGYHVLAFDLRCFGFSECGAVDDYVADTAVAVATLRAAGAKEVVVVGAGIGAGAALVAGAHLGDQMSGVVALSVPSLTEPAAPAGRDPRTPLAARTVFRVPLLLVYTERDRNAMSARSATRFVNESPSPDKRLAAFSGTAHGVNMLHTGGEIPVLVEGFLAQHTA
jgi:dienelactone hydrolase